jgi:hypothetical protein
MRDEIAAQLPRRFVNDVIENTFDAFAGAKRITDIVVGCDEPERCQMLGQHRHWAQEQGFRKAAEASGLQTIAPHTSPKGGRFSLVRSGNLVLARSKIVTAGSALRPSKYLQKLARHNQFFDPVQLDFFLDHFEGRSDDVIFGVIVTVASSEIGHEDRPTYLGIGIPSSSLKTWHYRDSLEDLLAGYREAGIEEIPDRALPVLKREADRKGAEKDA